ncbi:FIST signal transduction protein [Quadrisphaera sp. KR29]|uniref:FIST signal transduction protein n=1 Tax=Quadrisphaera sp. KR29 TaxID=3461391 RepID=UPI004044C974
MTCTASGAATSTLEDAASAGAAAARAAVEALEGARPGLVLVYTSVRYDLSALLAGVRSVTGATPLVGSTSAGHVVAGRYCAPGEGVAVLVLGGDRYRFSVASATGMAASPEDVGERLTSAARAAAAAAEASEASQTSQTSEVGPGAGGGPRPHAAVLLLTDGLAGDGQRVLKGVHRVAGAAVPVVGGAAGDDRQMSATSVFHDDRVLSDAAVGVWISSPQPLHVASAHGWLPVSAPEVVTRAEGLVVHEIGGRPAAEVYGQHAALGEVGARLAVEGESQASYGLGVIEPDGSHAVRGVYPLPGGALGTFTSIEEFSAVQVVTAGPQAVLDTVEPVVTAAVGDQERPGALLVFDCIGRADILGAAVHEEAAAMEGAARGARVFGLYSYGEFARSAGVGGTHNATLCALAL